MQFDSLLGALKTGKIDIIISGMTTTPERKEVDFTKPYMITNNVMMIKKMKQNVIKISKILKAKHSCTKGTDQEKLHKLRLKIVKFLRSIDYLRLYYL